MLDAQTSSLERLTTFDFEFEFAIRRGVLATSTPRHVDRLRQVDWIGRGAALALRWSFLRPADRCAPPGLPAWSSTVYDVTGGDGNYACSACSERLF